MRTNVRFKRFLNSIFIWRPWKPNFFMWKNTECFIYLQNWKKKFMQLLLMFKRCLKNETSFYRWQSVWKKILKRKQIRRAATETTIRFFRKKRKKQRFRFISKNRHRDNNRGRNDRHISRNGKTPNTISFKSKKTLNSSVTLVTKKNSPNCFNKKTKKNDTLQFGKQYPGHRRWKTKQKSLKIIPGKQKRKKKWPALDRLYY